ncbi:MAG: glycosyltransferase family 2 protein [bacterium]|nr:glycosyltransferase family 2 protein [bacterium]
MDCGDSADIAVIVTAHNYGRYLEACLRSVVSQTLPPQTVLVVDDASTDDTASVVEKFPEVQYYRVDFRNANRARNFGFSKVSAEWVVFFDADNYMAPGFLEALYEAADETLDFVYCDRINFAEGDVSWYPEAMGVWCSGPFNPDRLKRANYIDLASLVRSRSFPGFDGSLRRYQDWDLWLNLVLNQGGKGRHVAQSLFFYRVHGASISRTEDRDRARWQIGCKYRNGAFFSIPLLRDLFWLYRLLRRFRALFR